MQRKDGQIIIEKKEPILYKTYFQLLGIAMFWGHIISNNN